MNLRVIRGLAVLAFSLGAMWSPTFGEDALRTDLSQPGARGRSASAVNAGIQWVSIPGGSFLMGYGADDGWPSAKPAHQVTVKPFQMARTLVTNRQYKACVDAGACAPAHMSDGNCRSWGELNLAAKFQGADQPVVCVDWNEARIFAEWVGGRLPSEAEWEYAARSAGKNYKYPWGNEAAACDRAVILDNAAGGEGCGRKSTWPVCSKPKGNTEQGLCDMAGNIWVWLQDWYHDSYNGAPNDGSAWEKPICSNRAVRGGAWRYDASLARAAYRGSDGPWQPFTNVGIRPVRAGVIEPTKKRRR